MPPHPPSAAVRSRWVDLAWVVLLWDVTAVLVFVACAYGAARMSGVDRGGVVQGLKQFDALHYERVAQDGYSYEAGQRSEVAFFPGVPLAARALAWAARCSAFFSLLVVANVSFLGCLYVFGRYLARADSACEHSPDAIALSSQSNERVRTYGLVAMALYPFGFFCRMAYSEAAFLLVALLVLYGIRRRWPLLWIAATAGLASGIRPVGVALLVPLFFDVLRRSRTSLGGVVRFAALMPVAVWGLLAYMAYQYAAFGEPLAFAKVQSEWYQRTPVELNLYERFVVLASLEPVWSVYVPSSEAYWARSSDALNWLVNLQFANPIVFVTAVGLLFVGIWKRWIDRYEAGYGFAVLAIPYATRGFEMCMNSQARFTVVAFPIYIVIGNLLARSGWLAKTAILLLLTFYLLAYSAMFGAGYLVY